MKPLDPRLIRHTRAIRRLLAGSVAVGIASAACVLIQAVMLADIIASAAMDGARISDLRTPLAALGGVTVARATLNWAGQEFAQRSAATLTVELRRALLRRIVALGPRWAGQQRAGEVTTLAGAGIDGLREYAANYLPKLMLAVIAPATMLVWLATADVVSAATVAITLPLIPLFMALVGWHTERMTKRRWRALAVLSGHFLDVVAGLPTLKVFGRAKAQAEAVRRTTGDYRTATMATLRIAFLSSLVLELLATISVALVAVSVGLRLVDGGMDLRTGLAILIVTPEAYLPLRAVGAQFHASMDGLTAAEDVFAVLEAPARPAGTAMAPDPARTSIAVTGVRVRYADRPVDALRCPDVTIGAGRITAVVGPSGAGKTTLLQVLAGLVAPDAGSVVVGARDLADVDPAQWRAQLGYLAQQPGLFAGTVADNLRLGDHAGGEDGLTERAWLAQAAADEVVAELPDGAATLVGEGGVSLSVGQRQRLALARVFARDARLLLLDEPTSALGAATERRVLAAVRRHAAGRTVVVATHRPAVVAIADDVVVLSAAASDPARSAPHVTESDTSAVATPSNSPAVTLGDMAVGRAAVERVGTGEPAAERVGTGEPAAERVGTGEPAAERLEWALAMSMAPVHGGERRQ